MKKLYTGMQRFVRDEAGVTVMEYALIASLISIVAIIAMGDIGDAVNTTFGAIATALS